MGAELERLQRQTAEAEGAPLSRLNETMSMDLSAHSDREGEMEPECKHVWDAPDSPPDSWRALFACCIKCHEFQHPQATETTVPTFIATIYLGLKERESKVVHPVECVRALLSSYCDEVGFCVSLTSTEFVYTDGTEPGVIIGLINYPRFPASDAALWQHALNIAGFLRASFGQLRVSVVGPKYTTMLSAPELPE